MKVEDVDTVIQTLETYGGDFWGNEEGNASWIVMEIIEILNSRGIDLELTLIGGGIDNGIRTD